MTMFYYVGVSTSTRLKTAGKIESPNERDARMNLNKMGLAILTLTDTKPADFKETVNSSENTFEFFAKDKFSKEVNGTIDAIDREAAYDRLISEFNFEVNAIYPTNASAQEKARAIKESIPEILSIKAKRKEEEDNIKKRTLRGGFESLVKLAGVANDAESKNTVEIERASVKAAAKAKQTKDNSTEKKEVTSVQEAINDDLVIEVKPLSLCQDNDQDLEEKVFQSRQFFGKLYFRLTELIIPLSGKTRREAWEKLIKLFIITGMALAENWKKWMQLFHQNKTADNDSAQSPFLSVDIKQLLENMLKFKKFCSVKLNKLNFFHAKDAESDTDIVVSADTVSEVTPSEAVKKFSIFDPMDRKAFFQHNWNILEDLTNILVFIYFSYFIVGNFALHYQWGIFTDLALDTLQHDMLIPFLTFTFVFTRLLIWLREKLTSWSLSRTTFLFTSGSLFLAFLGLNLLV